MEFNQYPSQYYDYNVHGYLPSLHWCSRCPSSTKWVSTSFPLPSHPFQQPVYPTPTPPENPPFPLPDQLEVISNSIQDLVVKLKESNSCMLSTFSHMQSLLQEMQSDLMALDDATLEDATLEDAIDTAALSCISETDSDLIKGNSRTVDIKEETKYVEENYSRNDASKVLATQVFDEMFKPLSTVKCGFEVKEDEANAFVHHNTQLESTNKVLEIACEVPITDFPFDPGTCSVEDLLLGYFALIQHHVFDTMSCRIYCSKLWEVLCAECSINSTSRYSGDSTLQLERITIYHDAIRGVVEVQGELKEIIHYIRDPKTYTHLSGPLANTMLFFCFLATGHNMLSRVAKITFDSDLDTGQSEELLQDACDDFNVFRYAQSATKLLTSESESSLEVGQYHVDSLFAKSIERDTEKSVHSLAYKESLLMSLDYQACPVPLATLKLTKTDYLFEDALLRHAHNDPCPQAILVDTLGATRDILWLQQNLCIRVRIWFGTGQSIILVGKPGFGQCLVELSIAGSKYWWTVLAAYTSAFSITSTSCEFQLQPKHCNILRNMGNTMVCLLRSFVDGNHRVFEASARYFAIAYYSAESQQVVTTQLIHVSHCDPAKICRDNGQVTRFDNFPWDLFVHSAVIGVHVQSAWLNQKRSLFSVLISHVMIAALARTPTVTDIAVHIYENSGWCRSMLESELSLVAAKDEMTSLKVCIIRMTGGQSDIYYVIGKSRKSVQNSPFLEKLMTGGYTILFRENVVDAYAAGKLKEYDGTKLVSATKERLKLEAIDDKQRKKEDTKKSFDNLCKSIKDILGDKVQKMIICDRIVNSPCRLVIGEYGWPTYLTRVMKACLLRSSSMSAYMSREKVVEIKWDSGILQELSKKAEVDKNDKYVKDLVLLLHAVGRDGTVMPALEEKENSHLTITGNTRVIYQASGKVCFTIAPAGWSFTLLSFAKPYVKPHGVSFDAAKFAKSSFLPKLGFRPFYYGLKIMYAYENILAFSQKVLDLLEDLIAKLAAELPDGFGLSMVLAYLIVDIVPHVFIYAYIFATKRKYSFRVYREVHEYLQGLSKFDAAPASPVTILAYKHYYAPDDRRVSWSLCARCVHHGTVFTMSSLTKVNRLLLSTFILWFPSCQHGFIFAQCYLPEGFQIVTVIIGWSLLSGSLHLSQFALVGFGRSLDNTHWVNVALTSPNKKLYNVGLYSIVHEIFGVMGQLLARIRYILSFSELMIMKIVGISNLKMVEVLVGFFVLNLEDKVLIEGRGIVMNVTKLEDTLVELSNYVWDPG